MAITVKINVVRGIDVELQANISLNMEMQCERACLDTRSSI